MAYVKKDLVLNSLDDLAHKNLIENDNDTFISLAEAKDLIEELPDEDVAEIRYGKWTHLGGDEWCCSVCGEVITTEGSWDIPTMKHCYECGAKMGANNEQNR